MRRIFVPQLLAAAVVPSVVSAFSFNIQSTPQQCTNLSIAITGSGGQPPYSVLILPFGPTPLPNSIEARKIVDQSFGSNSATSVTFQLKYPTDSQFVAVVSDSTGFGTGGASGAATVLSSSDSSCYNATQSVQPEFFINLDPANQIVQCSPSRIWWNASQPQGTVNIFGVIPGGQSFQVPVGSLTNQTSEGTGFEWTPSVRQGSQLILIGGDNTGIGSGGSVQNTVSAGLNPNSSCIDNSSPSSTPGSPAGGSYPTSTSGSTTNPNTSSGNNTGAIVGGVVGGIVALVALLLLLLFFRRRRRHHKQQLGKERPDLFNEGPETARNENVPGHSQLEPFIVPAAPASQRFNPSEADGTENAGFSAGGTSSNRYSYSTDADGRPVTPLTSSGAGTSTTATRKSGAPLSLRPVNIIQHDDAGTAPTSPPPGEDETVELPPAYTNIKRNPSKVQK